MRLGAPVLADVADPASWAAELRRLGYRAAYCPIGAEAPDDEVRAYAEAARSADVVIAEVGAWSNLISVDDDERRAAIRFNQQQLALADRIGARCSVNFAGSRSTISRSAPDPENLSADTFALIVDTVREIVDAVEPAHACFTLELMPWAFPDSADSYVELLRAVERERFAVHLDPVNIICSPRSYFGSADVVRECVAKLGPWIKSCHVKDTLLHRQFMTHIDECAPGLGTLDHGVLLRELDGLGDPDLPLMMEHLTTQPEYDAAAAHLRGVAQAVGVAL